MAEFVGNITEPTLTFTQSGKAKLDFRLPVDKRKKVGNDWETVFTSWWGVTLWEEQAENAAQLLHKGSRVIISGTPVSRPYKTKEGENRTSAEIEVDHIGIVIPRKPAGQTSTPVPPSTSWVSTGGAGDGFDSGNEPF